MNPWGIERFWDNKWSRTSAVVLFLVAVLLVVLTLDRDDRPLTIAVKRGVEGVALRHIARNFSQEFHVAVNIIDLPYDDLFEEEERQLSGRRSASVPQFDVIMVDDPWLYRLATDPDPKKACPRLENLNDLMLPHEGDFFESTRHASQFRASTNECSGYLAVPFVANSQLFAYRTADIKEHGLPRTWDDVRSIAKAVEAKHEIGYVARIGPGNSIVTDFMPILWAYDSDSFPEYPGQGPPLKHPEAAFATLKTLVAERKNLGTASFDDFDVSAYLQSGRASMGVVWTAWAMMLALTDESTAAARRKVALADGTGGGDTAQGKLKYLGIPRGPGSTAEPELGVWLLAIPSQSKHNKLARKFIEFATDMIEESKPNRQAILAAHYGTPPPRQSALRQLEGEEIFKGLVPAIEDSLKNSRLRPRTACWREIESQLGTFLEQLTEDRLNESQIAEHANRQLEPLFTEEGCRSILRPPER